MSETYLWSHQPFVSSPPEERLKHIIQYGDMDQVDEVAVFRLQNQKFLFIRFYGIITDLSCGFTDVEEFEKLEDALHLYEENFNE